LKFSGNKFSVLITLIAKSGITFTLTLHLVTFEGLRNTPSLLHNAGTMSKVSKIQRW
jgi:hypothetical protein